MRWRGNECPLIWEDCCGDPKELKDRLTSIGKSQLIYGLSDREAIYVAFDAADGKVSESLIGEYADEGTAIEAMWGLIKLAQLKDETLEELRVSAEKMATLAFPEEKTKKTKQRRLVQVGREWGAGYVVRLATLPQIAQREGTGFVRSCPHRIRREEPSRGHPNVDGDEQSPPRSL